MEQWTVWLLLVTIFIPISFVFIATPFLTRRTESFGISVTEEIYWHEDVRKIRKKYALLLTILHTILFIITAASLIKLSDEKNISIAIGGYTCAVIVISFVTYLFFHYRMKNMKRERQWASPVMQTVVVDTSFRRSKLTVSSYWFIPHILLALATLVIVVAFYDQFPNELILKYDFSGNATHVVDKSLQALLWPIATQFILIAMFLFINYSIVISKQQIDVADPEASRQRSIIFRHSWSVFIVVTGFLMTLLFSFIPLAQLLKLDPSSILIVSMIVPGIVMIGSIWLSVRLGQGGSRIRIEGSQSAVGSGFSDDDRYWKLGGIYYNPADPALFLEKRFGIGWTINFGHKLSWVIMAALVVVIIASILMGGTK